MQGEESRKSKAFLEELAWGVPIDCGWAYFSSDEIMAFGQRFDPQPFHIDPEAARASLFGGLIASGSHISSVAHGLIERCSLSHVRVHAFAGVELLRLTKPVFAETRITVRHTYVREREPGTWPYRQVPGHALVECCAEVFDASGTCLMTFSDLYWIARRIGLMPADQSAEPLASAEVTHPRQPRPEAAGAGGTWLEDCIVGRWFGSGPETVSDGDVEMCQRRFAQESGSGYKEWVGFSFATGLFINALWRHGHASAGVAVEWLEWGNEVMAGQQLYGDVRIVAARTLSSRPEGLVRIAVTCTDSAGTLVCRFEIQVMVRRRSA